MNVYTGIRLLVFAKAPIPGTVKTRLLPVLDAYESAKLHAQLVERTLQQLTARQICPVSLYCSPDRDDVFFTSLGTRFGCDLYLQQGDNLGARMNAAVNETLEAGCWPLLVGTDCPDMNADVIEQACAALQQGNDAVLVPAEDGGYVLLGVKRPADSLFRYINWGSDRVLCQTRENLHANNWRWRELDTLWDLDRPADLERYRASLR